MCANGSGDILLPTPNNIFRAQVEQHSKSTSLPLFGSFIKTDTSHVMKAIWQELSLCGVLGGS